MNNNNNKLEEINTRNDICSCLDDIIKINDLDLNTYLTLIRLSFLRVVFSEGGG